THHATVAPYGAYTAKDGKEVLFSIQNEREWHAFCAFLDRPDIETDPRFATSAHRVANRAKLDAIITAKFSHLDSADIMKSLDNAAIANTGVNSVQEFLDHPVLTERARWQDVPIPGAVMRALVPPVTLAGVDARMAPVPAPGEHTARILAELGF